MTMTLAGLWLCAGIFVDGWAHNNLRQMETFFTPWHALLYSGFGACALWVFWLMLRNARAGWRGLQTLPRGYALGLAGVFIFGLAGLGDMAWHITFGIEQNLAALLSPTHLALFTGAFLLATCPVRAAWEDPALESADSPAGRAPRLLQLLPALLAFTFAVSGISFMTMYLWTFGQPMVTPGTRFVGGTGQIAALAGIIVTNATLIAPLLLAVRRWRLPFGSATILYTCNFVLMGSLHVFAMREVLVVGLVAGLAIDLLILALQPYGGRTTAFRALAGLAPLVLWSLYFFAEWKTRGLIWPPELWAGAIVWAAFCGVGLSLLVAPPAPPWTSGQWSVASGQRPAVSKT